MRAGVCFRVVLLGLLLTWSRWANAKDEPSLDVQLERSRIFEGQSVSCTVSVNNLENPIRPELEAPPGLDIEPRGESTRSQIVIVNGRRRETRATMFQYLITPREAGRYTLPAPTIEVDGKTYTANSVVLEVVPPESQDLARVELLVDRDQVYPTQPFTVTLRVLVKQLPDQFAERDPIRLLRNPPRLSIPWVNDDQLAEGIEPLVPWQRWLTTWQDRQGAGFRVNGIRSASLFSLLDNPGIGFLPEPERIRRTDADGKQVIYWQYEFPREFVANRVGQYTFGPARLEGPLIREIIGGREARVEDIYAFAQPVTVRVKEVPEAGHPESYIHAAGSFRLQAELQPSEARLGDPITLTITLEGRGTLDTATAPDLERVPEIREKFRIYEATSNRERNRKQFIYSLRPLDTGIDAFPSVPISYFDVEQEKFVTRRTERLPLRVRASERLDTGQITSADRPGRETIEAREEGIRANITDLSAVQDDRVHPMRWLLTWSGIGGLFVAVLLVVRQFRRHARNDTLRRKRQAAPTAHEQLDRAEEQLRQGNVRQAADAISSAICRLVAIAADRDESTLTAADVAEHLRAGQVDRALIDETTELLDACDGARYGGRQALGTEIMIRARRVIERIIADLKRRQCLG